MTWSVYIAKARTGRYYTGITTDTDKRIVKHNSGKGSRFAIEQGPFELVYSSKKFSNKLFQLKSWSFALSLHELCWRSVYSLAFNFDINVEVESRVNINLKHENGKYRSKDGQEIKSRN